jgi:tetratricopeptide (TPR) repeat protein
MTNQSPNIKDSIHNFMDGNLSEPQKDQLWAELLGSPDDLDYLSTLATLKKMGKKGAFDFEDRPSEPKKPFQLFTLGQKGKTGTIAFKSLLAAATALIIGMAVLFNLFNTADPAEGISPIAMIEYEVERSAADLSLFENHMQRAVAYSASGQLEDALYELELASAIELDENQIIDLKLAEGTILYNSGKFSGALDLFKEVKNTDGLDKQNLEKSTWYLANTQIQLGMMDEAEVNIRKVIELDGAFMRVANQKLEGF